MRQLESMCTSSLQHTSATRASEKDTEKLHRIANNNDGVLYARGCANRFRNLPEKRSKSASRGDMPH